MLSDLYQELILDHGKKPRNYGTLPMATHEASGHNPFCGDEVKVRLIVADGVIQEIRFEGCGCAISTASASLMTQAVRGKTIEEAMALYERFREVVTSDEEDVEDEELGALIALAGVRSFPNRIKCATLAWHAMDHALNHSEEPASTEGEAGR